MRFAHLQRFIWGLSIGLCVSSAIVRMQSVSCFFVLGYGHAPCLPASYFSSGFKLSTKAVSGLKWID